MRILILFGFIFIFSLCSIAQQWNNWYFGYNAGITFNSAFAQALTDGQTFTEEGCAAISDQSGKLLFYTDGVNVWDRNHMLMPNGTMLMGSHSATSVLIVPKPRDTARYYEVA